MGKTNVEALLETLIKVIEAGAGGGATEATLLAVRNAIQAHEAFNILLVRDTGAANVVVQQVMEYNETTATWSTTYRKVDGTAHVVVGPLVYIDPSGVLQLILAQLDVATSTRASEVTLAALEAKDFATEATLQNVGSLVNDIVNGIANLATEATLSNVDTATSGIYNAIIGEPQRTRIVNLTNVAQAISGAGSKLVGWNIINPNATIVYVKFYNEVAGTVVVGTTPVVRTLLIPANGTVFLEATPKTQISFGTAMSIAAVTGIADNDAVAPVANVHAEISYEL